MTKKSNAQIKRMMHRASQRGEEYVAPILNVPTLDEPSNTVNKQDSSKLKAVTKLNKTLDSIDKDEEMRAKDRRSAKRKAEAIAIEESGVPLEDLLIWFKEHGASRQKENDVKQPTKKKKNMDDPFQNPYIVFIGQLAFTTTKEALLAHLKEELGKEFKITQETCRIRLLTDAKTNKSRGMAFLETNDPEMLYATLKLHHTMLDGRRLNVERSAGGGKETKKEKLKTFRKEQEVFLADAVDNMIQEYITSGELKKGELDDGVISLCKRHSPATVEATLIKYLESNGRDMDNSSSYFSFMIGKIAAEGLYESAQERLDKKRAKEGPSKHTGVKEWEAKKRRLVSGDTSLGRIGNKLQKTSEFAKVGVDMTGSRTSSGGDMTSIFPSSRGRGRGRGR
jgi:RNA recognition motif-containing protein